MSVHDSIDYRPSCGGGSCIHCGDALGLDAVCRRQASGTHVWFCSPTCAQGMPPAGKRQPAVDEARLYNRPRRFHAKRQPKELRNPGAGTH